MTESKPATPGWYWDQPHWDEYRLIGPAAGLRKFRAPGYVESIDGNRPLSFRSYADLCWWCGSHGINATQR